MKLLCYSKFLLLFLLLSTLLFASEPKKSAIVYYGTDISYPMVGLHDYIIVEPKNTDVYQHGFQVYKEKIYAYVSIGEIDPNDTALKKVDKKLLVGTNKAWKSHLLDITNPAYKEFLFKEMIEPQIQRGFKNFFFDTLDSYQLIAKTKEERAKSEAALVDIIHTFHTRYPHAKLILNRGFEIIDKVHSDITAILFESYYQGVGGKDLGYKEVTKSDREWLDTYLNKAKSYKLDIICIDYLPLEKLSTKAQELIQKLQDKGFIPYVTTRELNSYGYSSKNAVKREILTLIDENTLDRKEHPAHRLAALPLEYHGYIQKLYNTDTHKLPTMQQMQRYGGVVIWLTKPYKEPGELVEWIGKLQDYNIKVVFLSDFFITDTTLLKSLSLRFKNPPQTATQKISVIKEDPMVGFELKPPKNQIPYYIDIQTGEALYSVSNNNYSSTLAAIMPWGGFAVGESALVEIAQDNLWTINPFLFLKRALRLQNIPVPDTTTHNGRRILFSHVDGDGIMNRAEWNPELFSGDVIYSEILKKYPLPISVSVIGAEINKNGLYPELSQQLQKVAEKIFSLNNVEPATHTFTHPFFWNKIKNGNLEPKYRLKPKGYRFSLDYEIKGMLEEINTKFLPKEKYPKAQTLFWTGDCIPTENILHYVYKNNILNINGGDTYISNLHPWLSYIAPIGLGRKGYYQIYTGAQNENIYTNEWHGPFWGFKKVIQTFKLTDKPRRLKPIDIYYHLYSGSKRASLNALKYVYNWGMKQKSTPLFTSEYIKKAMDYYTVSLSQEDHESFYVAGMKNLKTLRSDTLEFKQIQLTENIAGFYDNQKEKYIHLGPKTSVQIEAADKKATTPYLISSNASDIESLSRDANSMQFTLKAHTALEVELFVPKQCKLILETKNAHLKRNENRYTIVYNRQKEAKLDVQCRE